MVGIGGCVLAVAVPAFVSRLRASKLSEPTENLERIVNGAIAHGNTHPAPFVFPPSVGLTPEQVPRGVTVVDKPGTWDHLTWRALHFEITEEHAFAYQFSSSYDQSTDTARFAATAHGDLDGDGAESTFTVFGEKTRTGVAQALPGMYVQHELE
jgi:hypothetical protein